MRTTSLWCESALPIPGTPAELPESADVVVVGGGFSGISAALELAREGVKVVLIDKEWPGYGA
ncbi:MAG TPA: FAD-binding oxidoreductase, partial [Flavobacteriales bacterium]|nr:FAD-binding oxidoreductase [Flavobacteriales bacterium]